MPEKHAAAGITTKEWPPRGAPQGSTADISRFFRVVYPELFRLQLSDQKSSSAPVLTLAVGG